MKLFTSNCYVCELVKEALDDDGYDYELRDINLAGGYEALEDACFEIGCVVPRSAPVLISGDDIWSGEDCLVAIREEEI